MHLFQEIKQAKDQLAALYNQMNRQVKPEDPAVDQGGAPVKQ